MSEFVFLYRSGNPNSSPERGQQLGRSAYFGRTTTSESLRDGPSADGVPRRGRHRCHSHQCATHGATGLGENRFALRSFVDDSLSRSCT
jgi:hypothetical protein